MQFSFFRMSPSRARLSIIILYSIAFILLVFTVGTFLYQYLAALGSLHAVIDAISSDRILSALWLSLSSALVVAALSLFLGIPLAYVFTLSEFSSKKTLETLAVDVPQTFPPVAEGMIYILLLGKQSPFHINLAQTFSALVIAKLYVSAPFVVSFTVRRFKEIKASGIHSTARSLGATPIQVFYLVFIPLSLKDIAAGASLCWSRAMGELGGSLLFAGVIPFKTEVIPTLIATQAHTLTIPALAATILVTTASTIALISFKRLSTRNQGES